MREVGGDSIVSGKTIFFIMDSKGASLDFITEYLRDRGVGFNVVEFVDAALESKNFTYETIKKRLVNSMVFDEEVRKEFVVDLDKIAVKRDWRGVKRLPFKVGG